MTCYICKMPALIEQRGDYFFHCHRCGQFCVEESIYKRNFHLDLNERQVANACGWIRDNQEVLVDKNVREQLSVLTTPTLEERSNNLLSWLFKKKPVLGDNLNPEFCLNFTDDFLDHLYGKKRIPALQNFEYSSISEPHTSGLEILSTTYSVNVRDFLFLLNDYCIENQGLLKYEESTNITKLVFTVKGWNRINNIFEEKSIATKETVREANRIIMLQPNIFGLGLNVNAAISVLLSKLKNLTKPSSGRGR